MRDRILRGVAVAAVASAVLAWVGAFAADRAFGRDVVLVRRLDADDVEARRALWRAEGAPTGPREVAAIYGQVVDQTRAIVPRSDRVLHPAEDPALSLYVVEPGDGRPLQARTMYWAVKVGAAVLAVAALLALAAGRRHVRAPSPSATRSTVARGDDTS